MINIDNIGKFLPLGYLYLVILGILNQTILFYQLNINIIDYSSILDILTSPIATLVSNSVIFIFIILLFILSYKLPNILYKHGHRKKIIKIFELKKSKNDLSDSELKSYYQFISVKTLSVILLSFYLGYGTAEGYNLSSRMKNNTLKYNYKLNYNTGESDTVCLIKSNSIYLFYVAKGEKNVTIAPVVGIKKMDVLRKKQF